MIMLLISKQHYGKVDHLKGLFYVTTEFLSLNFFPCIPLASYCLIDQPNTRLGVKLSYSMKSILLGYFRGITCVLTVLFMVFGVILTILDFKKIRFDEFSQPLQMICASLVGAGLLGLSYFWQKPKPLRALELAKVMGVPLEVLAEHYENDHQIDDLLVSRQAEAGNPEQ